MPDAVFGVAGVRRRGNSETEAGDFAPAERALRRSGKSHFTRAVRRLRAVDDERLLEQNGNWE